MQGQDNEQMKNATVNSALEKSQSNYETVNLETEPSEDPMCRICFRGKSFASLLTPCLCKGTMAFVHRNCLETWLTTKGIEQCDICKYKYTVERISKNSWHWFTDPAARKDRRSLGGYIFWAILTTPFVLQLVWNCFEKSDEFSRTQGYFWNATFLSSVAMFAILIHVTWIGLALRKCYVKFGDWKRRAFTIRISNCTPKCEKSTVVTNIENEEKPVCSAWTINMTTAKIPSAPEESFPLINISKLNDSHSAQNDDDK